MARYCEIIARGETMPTKIDIIANDLWNEYDDLRDKLKILLKIDSPLPEEFKRIKELLLLLRKNQENA